MELNHTSNTAFPGDDYNKEHVSHRMPDGWHKYFKGHVCYDADKVCEARRVEQEKDGGQEG